MFRTNVDTVYLRYDTIFNGLFRLTDYLGEQKGLPFNGITKQERTC